MIDDPIEDRLADIACHLEWDDEADLSVGVTRRLQNTPPTRRRTVLVGVAVAVVSLTLAISLIPAGRQAVADLLGVAGIEIEWESSTTPTPLGTLDLGDPVSLAEASEAVSFPLLIPARQDLGEPDGVYLYRADPTRVTLSWRGDDHLPAAGDTGIALIHTQFRSGGSTPIEKDLDSRTSLEAVSVRNRDGRWIEGAPHQVEVQGGDGTSTQWEVRLGANVLIWEEDGVTHRIETTLTLVQTLQIAESLQPAN